MIFLVLPTKLILSGAILHVNNFFTSVACHGHLIVLVYGKSVTAYCLIISSSLIISTENIFGRK